MAEVSSGRKTEKNCRGGEGSASRVSSEGEPKLDLSKLVPTGSATLALLPTVLLYVETPLVWARAYGHCSSMEDWNDKWKFHSTGISPGIAQRKVYSARKTRGVKAEKVQNRNRKLID